MKLLITIPTYNEIENIGQCIRLTFGNVPADTHIVVVDDSSPDGTATEVRRLMAEYPGRLYLLERPGKQGLGKAYLAAFDWGMSRGYDVFLEMDADLSHNPAYIPEMLENIKTHDVVIGSRNIKHGGVEGWSALRNFISKGGSLYARTVLECPVMDLTGGFNMWRRNALEKIGLNKIVSQGYSFQIEMKYKAFLAGCSIKEIPIIFCDRRQGKSKMSKKIFIEAVINVWKMRKKGSGKTGLNQFARFAVTGGLGTITNLAVFFVLADILKLPEIPVSIGCFIIAVSQNYVINHRWSFKSDTHGSSLSLKQWLMFVSSSLLGLAANIIVMQLILANWTVLYKFIAQGFGILAGMVINFAFAKTLVFRKRRKS